MDDRIIKIIIDTAGWYINNVTQHKGRTFIESMYVGLRYKFDKMTLVDIGKELNRTASGVYKLLEKFDDKCHEGDMACLDVIKAYAKSVKLQNWKSIIYPPVNITVRKPRKSAKIPSLGFRFSKADIDKMHNAIRSAILFMDKYGRGVSPKIVGDNIFFRSDDNTGGKWMPQQIATTYCNCDIDMLNAGVTEGKIRGRIYRNTGKHKYMEYLISDLDEFIKQNKL